MRYILIDGILFPSLKKYINLIKKIDKTAEIFHLGNFFYTSFSYEKINNIVNEGIKNLENEKSTIIIAHSFGGIIARIIYEKTQNKSSIKKIITLATPHNMFYGNIKTIFKRYNLNSIIDSKKYVTYGGYFDPLVPFVFTKVKGSKHQNLFTHHWSFLYSDKMIHNIIDKIKY